MIATLYYLGRMGYWLWMGLFYILAYTGIVILWMTRLCIDAGIWMTKVIAKPFMKERARS